jgi:SAM-dependent methyltransferase
MIPQIYNTPFFQLQQSQSYKGAKNILPQINEWIKPTSVIDIGCGVGAWLKVFKELNVKTITGLDGDYVKMENLLIDKNEFITADLEKPISLNNKFDLVMCLEVAEHLTINRAESFIADLCKMGDIILFSAAIPGQEGTLHINEQYPGYWINAFKKNNFECIDCIRPLIWNNTEIEFWYKQNIMFFADSSKINKYAFLKSLPSFFGNSMVHPVLLEYKNGKSANYNKILNNPFRVVYFYLKKAIKVFKK